MRPFVLLFTSILILTIVVSGCNKDTQIDSSPGAMLTFSEDTVVFDTVFTEVGTTTHAFKVYNNNSGAVKISNIDLAGGNTSNFRLNIDGKPANNEQDLILEGGDSIYVFVEATIDPNGGTTPMVITDSVVFETNGNIQDVDLVAWGQDAHFHYNEIFCGEILENDKPHVFYGYAVVDSSCGLFILEGSQLHFHSGSGLVVYKDATLRVLGTADQPVIIQGDRLEDDYKELPGQWDRIWFYPTSHSNVIQHAIIKNGTVGIQSDTTGHPTFPTARIVNTRIENMSGVGILGRGSWFTVDNSVIADCGQFAVALIYGGAYSFNHVTIANYYNDGARENPSIILNNYFETAAGNIQTRDLLQADFLNSIVIGDHDEEIGIDQEGDTPFNYLFDHSVLKTELDTSDTTHFKSVLLNPAPVTLEGESHHPIFTRLSDADYSLHVNSVAIGIGDPATSQLLDITGASRDTEPDAGAYEYLP